MEGGVGEDVTEAVEAHVAVADVLVAVADAAEGHLAVVGVDGAEAVEADLAVELGHGDLAALAGRDLVAHGEGVAGVEADADAGVVPAAADELAHLGEGGANAVPLAGVVLDEEHGVVVGGFEDFEHDAADLVLHRVEAGAFVAAYVEDGALDAERSRPRHVLLEGAGGAVQELLVLRSKIDQVDAVKEDGHWDALVFLVEGGDGLVADVGGAPLLGRGDEELDGLGADRLGAGEDVLGASGGGDVGADSHGGECTRGNVRAQA